eukprot:1161923-Pelagomonas_calceolata.AAC.13
MATKSRCCCSETSTWFLGLVNRTLYTSIEEEEANIRLEKAFQLTTGNTKPAQLLHCDHSNSAMPLFWHDAVLLSRVR